MTRGRNNADPYRLIRLSGTWPGSRRRIRRKGGGTEVERMGLYAALKRRLGSEEGATAVEYALMVALIALVIVAAVTFLGQSTNSVFENDELIKGLT